MYRRKRHDNELVAATDACLRRVCTRWKADVDVKQRVADVLDIDALGLTGDDRWYALSAHFDFVVWRDNDPKFAIEFDERHHFTDPAQLVKDERKNAICKKAFFPILRLEDGSLRRVGNTQVVEWLSDLWFVYHDLWLAARAGWDESEGYDPDDWDDDLYAAVKRRDEFRYTDFMASADPDAEGVPEFAGFAPYDPFSAARRSVTIRGFEADLDHDSVPEWYGWPAPAAAFYETDLQGREVGHVAVPVGRTGVVMGSGRCWSPGVMFTGDPNLGIRVATDLAVQQAADFLDLYDRGKYEPVSWDEAGRQLAGKERSFVPIARLDQHDHREMAYRRLRKWGMPHDAAQRAAYSLQWDDDGRLIDDDDARWLDD